MKKPEYYDLAKSLTNGLVISIDGEKHKTAVSYLTEIWQKLKFPGTHINWDTYLDWFNNPPLTHMQRATYGLKWGIVFRHNPIEQPKYIGMQPSGKQRIYYVTLDCGHCGFGCCAYTWIENRVLNLGSISTAKSHVFKLSAVQAPWDV